MDTTQTITHISLCAGYGGIDLGLRGAIANLRTVAFSEIEAFATANLVAKMEAGLLDCAPIWTDLKTFPWGAFRDRVDILSGGYPCQPFSAAGKRLGTEDPRHLWPFIANGIRILRPKLCFFENVEGHISLGLREVIGELESMGYAVSWGIFSAREVGAPHQRKRVFILAMADNGGEGLQGLRKCCGSQGWQAQIGHAGSRCDVWEGGELADTNSAGSRQDWESGESRPDCIEQSSFIEGGSESGKIQKGSLWPSRPGQPQYAFEPPRVVANSASAGRESQRDQPISKRTTGLACQSSELADTNATGVVANSASQRTNNGHQLCDEEFGQGRSLPLQSDYSGEGTGNANSLDRRTSTGERIDDAETASAGEIVGNTAGRDGQRSAPGEARHFTQSDENEVERQVEPSLGGDADGTARGMDYAELSVTCDNRTDELRLLGNGVVPATATLAFQTLLAELLSL